MTHWQQYDTYDYTQRLSAAHWAWEFLRRNPEYLHDWDMFNQRWQALEYDYGKAPQRDFQRWKKDPRAVVSESDAKLICPEELGIACATEDNKILIECWMGAKWGFYKFPLNPNYAHPKIPSELLWRERDIKVKVLDPYLNNLAVPNNAEHLSSLQFDLRFSLQEQLKSARIQLANIRRNAYKTGKIKLRIKDHVPYWTYLLRYADALQIGTAAIAAQKRLQSETSINLQNMSSELEAIWQGEYLDILLLKA
jgi:hypothetical protein